MQSRKTAILAATLIATIATPAIAADSRLKLAVAETEPAGSRTNTDADLATLRAAVTKDPKDRAARFALVRALQRAKKLDEALAAAKDWRNVDAYNLVVVRLLGDIYSEKGDRAKARRAYSAVVELLPEDAAAHRALASVLKQSGDLKGAYDRLTAAAAAGSKDRRLAFELADVAARLDMIDEARERFEAIIADPDTADAVRYPAKQRLAQIYGKLGKKDEVAKLGLSGGTENDIKVYLTWDTDHSDVDLWVTTPGGEKVFYSHRNGKNGEALYDDVTTGYGPESFTAAKAAKGEYLVQVNYFGRGRSNFSEARGEVVVVLDEGKPTETKHVLPYRLFDEKQTVTVARITVGAKIMKATILKTLLLGTLVSCGGGSKREDLQGNVGSVVATRPAMTVPLAAITVRGELSAKQGDTWMPMIEGNTLANIREVKTERRGAIVALGDAAEAPLLYLRAGTHVALTQDGSGVHVAVLEGRARLRRGASVSSYIDTDGGEVIVVGDVLVDARPKSRGDVRPTGARPSSADWSFALQQPDTGMGAGRMEARVGTPDGKDKMEAVELKNVMVDVKTAGDQAITEVTHIFHNAIDERREGTFRFPVPDGALLVGLAMEIDGKMVEGEMVEREKARAVYEKIVDEMLDPALLEWEQGNWFKLRVFPLEAKADKKVVIRYVTQMTKTTTAQSWEYDYSLSGQSISNFSMTVDGKPQLAQKNIEKGIDLVIPVSAKVPDVMVEKRTDAIYTAIRIAPHLGIPQWAPSVGSRNIAIVIDTSRSSLEGRAQQLEVLESTVRQLAPTDRFTVLAADVEIQQSWPGYVAASEQAIKAAKAMIEGIEPDGASDLGNTFATLDAQNPSQVIYIGDGIATWGEQRTEELAKLAKKIGVPVDAALVGKGASTALWAELSGETGGRSMIVKSELDEQRFALAATQADMPRLTNATIVAPNGSILFPATATTVFDGEDMVAVMKLPADAPMPPSVKLVGTLAGRPYSEDIQLTAAVATDRVGQRWARQMLAKMEASNAGKEEIVALSTELGVMSKYTSLLVLENDEAYKKYEIERKNQKAADALKLAQATTAPTVTGGDLDSLGAREASLSPDEVQPGDPEIKIPAPLDAQSVVVSFPFGETKLAVWDQDVNAWMVRFLIDQMTADGIYYARVTITHADGRIEVIQLPYTVDTKAPIIKATSTKVGSAYHIKVKQQRDGTRPKDAERVEIVLPDGTIMKLGMTEWGVFEGDWTPASPLTGPLTLQVFARDNALNQSNIELVLQ